jgi:carboxyl-terminal processing protease
VARYYTPSGRPVQRPYGKNIEEYRRAAADREETEGDNLEHKEEKDTTKPAFKTASGRPVFGGGGITPDYIVKGERASPLFVQVWSKGVFREYALGYIEQAGQALQKKYGKDIRKFRSDFEIDPVMCKEFEKMTEKKGVTIDSAQFQKELPELKTRVKAEIARAIWGNEGWYSTISSEDNQLQKALTLFPEAEKIAGLR